MLQSGSGATWVAKGASGDSGAGECPFPSQPPAAVLRHVPEYRQILLGFSFRLGWVWGGAFNYRLPQTCTVERRAEARRDRCALRHANDLEMLIDELAEWVRLLGPVGRLRLNGLGDDPAVR